MGRNKYDIILISTAPRVSCVKELSMDIIIRPDRFLKGHFSEEVSPWFPAAAVLVTAVARVVVIKPLSPFFSFVLRLSGELHHLILVEE